MTFLRVLSVAIILLQILNSNADPKATVVGPQQFLDSGQEIEPSGPSIEASRKIFDSEEESYDSSEEAIAPEENIDSNEDDDSYLNGSNEERLSQLDSEEYGNVPLKRVRRRIIPVGKALDRGSTGERDPYGRGRSPWAEAPTKKDALVKRKGPTGSDALFTLYPDLASPEWREAHGITSSSRKKKIKAAVRKSKHQERDTQGTERIITKPVKVVNNSKSYSKRKNKLSKDMKEEIAAYANIHGAQAASEHFSTKYRTTIKLSAVKKYLRRYKSRQVRREERQG